MPLATTECALHYRIEFAHCAHCASRKPAERGAAALKGRPYAGAGAPDEYRAANSELDLARRFPPIQGIRKAISAPRLFSAAFSVCTNVNSECIREDADG